MTPGKLNRIEAAAILEEAKRRRSLDGKAAFEKKRVQLSRAREEWYRDRCGTHHKQHAFVVDEAKKIALLCPRRTGKTSGSILKVLRTAEVYPGSMIAYIVPSSKHHAQRLFWDPLEKLEQRFRLGLQFKVAEHTVVTSGGSRVYVFGAKSKESANVLRGNAWSIAVLDECKDFGPHFESLMIEAVLPGLEDYDGQLVLEGTPGSVLDGQFYQITDPRDPPDGWSVHKWIKSDNTHLPEAKRNLDVIEREEYAPFGLTKQSPKFRREQLAEWCTEDDERAYLYDTHRNGWDGVLPAHHEWMYALGLDLGERDANAFVVFAFSLTHRTAYVVHEFARARMSIDEIAAKIKELVKEFGTFATMVADTGGYGRGVVTDMQLRHNLPLEAADKRGNKLGNIALMNADFLCGQIKARDHGLCATEWKRLTRRIRSGDKKVIITHSDVGDAGLYAWKACRNFASVDLPVAPEVGTQAYFDAEERKAVDHALKRRRNREAGYAGSAPTDF